MLGLGFLFSLNCSV